MRFRKALGDALIEVGGEKQVIQYMTRAELKLERSS
jgi:hypothetical protein